MLDLRIFLLLAALIFAYIGARRGFNQEIIVTAGILLALFGLREFDDILRNQLLSGGASWLQLTTQLAVFSLIVYFSYHTRAVIGPRALAAQSNAQDTLSGRSNLQEGVLGGLVGALNGYLIAGSFWYFAHVNDYPLLRLDPATSADILQILPPYLLAGGLEGGGEPLTLAVFCIFLVVLILI